MAVAEHHRCGSAEHQLLLVLTGALIAFLGPNSQTIALEKLRPMRLAAVTTGLGLLAVLGMGAYRWLPHGLGAAWAAFGEQGYLPLGALLLGLAMAGAPVAVSSAGWATARSVPRHLSRAPASSRAVARSWR